MPRVPRPIPLLALLSWSGAASALETAGEVDLTGHWEGILVLAIFLAALSLATCEEFTQLRKSKPMLLAAGMVWVIVFERYTVLGVPDVAAAALRESLLRYTELMLFLLVVMTYVNALSERRLFAVLRNHIGRRCLSYRRLFWVTGALAFALSPVLDNLSVALIFGAMIFALRSSDPRFTGIACIHIVVAANAGGVFSPFGDLTTLMVWLQHQETPQGVVDVLALARLAPPALVAWLVPAAGLSLALPRDCARLPDDGQPMRRGARRIVLLFLATIATSLLFRARLQLPAVVGMMTGLAYLQFFGFYLRVTHRRSELPDDEEQMGGPVPLEGRQPFDIFPRIARVEWDALLFLCGLVLCVGALDLLGWIERFSDLLYDHWGADLANPLVGVMSGAVESVTTMYTLLSMRPEMSLGHWLSLTLATGVGGSLLSIGSAASIALMGQSDGRYTFFVHLRWSPLIALGFALAIATHHWLNAALF